MLKILAHKVVDGEPKNAKERAVMRLCDYYNGAAFTSETAKQAFEGVVLEIAATLGVTVFRVN